MQKIKQKSLWLHLLLTLGMLTIFSYLPGDNSYNKTAKAVFYSEAEIINYYTNIYKDLKSAVKYAFIELKIDYSIEDQSRSSKYLKNQLKN